MSVVTKIGLAALAAAASVSASPFKMEKRDYNPDTFQDDAIRAHNFYRAQHDAPDVAWDQGAADNAQNWANTCTWGHQEGNSFGENIAYGYGSVFEVVDGWAHERDLYDFNNPGFSMETGHFTQVVWKATTGIGCAYTDCGQNGDPSKAQGIYVVCEYSPPGNMVSDDMGYFRDNVTPQTSGNPQDNSGP